jgi:hypothetical protein
VKFQLSEHSGRISFGRCVEALSIECKTTINKHKKELHSLFLSKKISHQYKEEKTLRFLTSVPDLFQDAYKVKKYFLLNNGYYILVFWDVMS